MCGIVGLYLKNPALDSRLGELFVPMLVEMTNRGPDSAGLAIYHQAVTGGRSKITAHHPDPDFDWSAMARELTSRLGGSIEVEPNATHCVIETDLDADAVAGAIEARDPNLQIMSVGDLIEIYKEVGLPAEVVQRFRVADMQGSHVIGHTRMATESAVMTAGSHPFSTGRDLCLVHNGSLSNHNNLREWLKMHRGIRFRTDNDTEVGAAYIESRLREGRTLHEALEDCLTALDGFYTFVAGTRDGFAVLRDPIACKPAVLAETDDWVAFGSEYRALTGLPGIEHAMVWEPEPAQVYSWGARDAA